MSERKMEKRKEWIGHGIKLYDRLDADGHFCYQAGRIGNVCLHPCCGSWGLWLLYGSEYVSFLTVTYRKVGESVEAQALIMQENTEQSTLVTTLEDGSIVYMGGETSLQYPEHFSMDKREVSLQGNALFDVTGNRERPFSD